MFIKNMILVITLSGMLPVCAAAQAKKNPRGPEDPVITRRRVAEEAQKKAGMEAEIAFLKSLENKTPDERAAARKARREEKRRLAQQQAAQRIALIESVKVERSGMIKPGTEMDAAGKARMEENRAFVKSLEGKTPVERVAAVQARYERQQQAAAQRQAASGEPAQAEDPVIAKRRAEIKERIKARMEADRVFLKSLEGKTPAERAAAIKARREEKLKRL